MDVTAQIQPLFSLQFSLKREHYCRQSSCVTLVAVDVFAWSRDEAIELAQMTLRHPGQFDIDHVMEN